jgi:hypothetical protein
MEDDEKYCRRTKLKLAMAYVVLNIFTMTKNYIKCYSGIIIAVEKPPYYLLSPPTIFYLLSSFGLVLTTKK